MPDLNSETPPAHEALPAEKRSVPHAFYHVLDKLSGRLILLVTVATPWLFGTADNWAVRLMTIICCGIGLLLAAKRAYCRIKCYAPPRWGDPQDRGRWITRTVAVLTVVALAYCLVSALNARASFDLRSMRFEYHSFKHWLPATYDDHRSWPLFWAYLSLACFFWSLRDWLLGQTAREVRELEFREPDPSFIPGNLAAPAPPAIPLPPDRLRRLLWTLSINGAALALQGILQRLGGGPLLLWFHNSYWVDPESFFGPFSYRSNAAQYLNLVWPLALGLWWTLNEARRSSGGRVLRMGEGPHVLLLPLTIAMAAGPIISTSRGGALVAGFNLLLAFFLIFINKRTRASTRAVLVGLMAVILGGAWVVGGAGLQARFKDLARDKWSGRGEIYANSQQIAADYPLFGTGPGTFRSVYELYRDSSHQDWAAYLHDDWMETRVTFGIVGFSIFLTMLLLASSRWFVPGAIPTLSVLAGMSWVAVGGCLLHAKFDFPLQVYSILLVFLINCAILFTTSRPTPPSLR